MSAGSVSYRWTPAEFLRADEAGVFESRVELVEGEVWPVVIGDWHGPTVARCIQLLSRDGVIVTMQTLPTAQSLPDPDVWVRAVGAEPAGKVSPRLSRWGADDVLLVVEISDETLRADLGVKARLYGAAGYATYWVITQDTVHVHTDPVTDGYRTVTRYRAGEWVTLPYASDTVAVAELLGS